jgi:VIT1/CCC1 family predicted Fe2+/Mn2+ transporter
MGDVLNDERERLLDPVDRICEILFGLIMAVTIVGSLSIATAGRAEIRTVMAAALGCNLAWGLVDAVMYLLRMLTARTRNRALAKRVVVADASSAHRLIEQALPEHVAAITGPDEIEGMRRRLVSLRIPGGAKLRRDDYLAALVIFLLVVIATFPVVVPFMLISDAARAMNVSRVVTVAMLFVAGIALGRYAGHERRWLAGVLMALLGVAIIAAVMALGG